jgi:HMG (high mobility group) box
MNRSTNDQCAPMETIDKSHEIASTYDLDNAFIPARNLSNQVSDLNVSNVDLNVYEDAAKTSAKPPVKRSWKKPSDMPKRPMSSYNLFYRMERERIIEGGQPMSYTIDDINLFLEQQNHRDSSPKVKRKHRKTHGKISFTDLARNIASSWRGMDDASKAPFRERAVVEKNVYIDEIEAWNQAKASSFDKGTKRKLDDPTPKKMKAKAKLQSQEFSLKDGDLSL